MSSGIEKAIVITGADAVVAALAKLKTQIPFAMVKTLNAVANDAQREVRVGLGAFTLRRKAFVERTIFRDRATDFASKTSLVARVRIDPRADFLAQHEDGGTKTPRDGRSIAIPLPAVQKTPTTVIPRALRPGALKANPMVRRIVTGTGVFLIRETKGRGKARVGARSEFLYQLKPSVPLKPRLSFARNAEKAVDASFERIATAQIDALRL
jgi:hypothetical protein